MSAIIMNDMFSSEMAEKVAGSIVPDPQPQPQPDGIFVGKPASQWLTFCQSQPLPRDLFKGMWREGEVACLFGDSNCGKSVLATQIAEDVAASGVHVAYFDFEQSAFQFFTRYVDDLGTLHVFPSDLIRFEVARYTEVEEKTIMAEIEKAAISVEASVVIIDNLTWLCSQMDSGADAGKLMQALLSLKRRWGWSLLVVAHTPKRNMATPITQNSMAGSKRLVNLFDSVFALGMSGKGEKVRYIKQLKARCSPIEYGRDSVLPCVLSKYGNTLRLGFNDFTEEEDDHLKAFDSETRQAMKMQRMVEVQDLSQAGLSLREISDRVGVSKTQVSRILRGESI